MVNGALGGTTIILTGEMDPSSRQNAAYQATQLSTLVEQKAKIAVSKIKGKDLEQVRSQSN